MQTVSKLASVIGFIGAGHMTRSLVSGLLADGYLPKNIVVTNRSPEKAKALQQVQGVQIAQTNVALCQQADMVILAVKPQQLKAVLEEIQSVCLEKKPLLISLAAGITFAQFAHYFQALPVIRAMPNTPALIRAGMTGLVANAQVLMRQKEQAESIFRAVGAVLWVENEPSLDALMLISGSGPGYFFYIMESLQQIAQSYGLEAADAKLLILQTVFGAAKMALESDEPLATLRDQVTSKKGVTHAIIADLEANELARLLANALDQGLQRAAALQQTL